MAPNPTEPIKSAENDAETNAVEMTRGIIKVFGTYLDALRDPSAETPAQDDWQSLLSQLQDTNLLAMPLLPEEIRIAIGHIDGSDPARTLGYVREAFIRACSFVRAHNMT